jgi:hypothetical protein
MKTRLSLLAAFFLLAGYATVKAQDADDIVQKYIAAIGGVKKLNSIKTITIEGISKIDGGGQVPITVTKEIGKAMKTDFFVNGRDNYTILTTKEGWQYNPDASAVEPMSAEQVKSMQSQLYLDNRQITEYKKNGTKLEYIGKERANKALCYKIKFTGKDGYEITDFFDVQTYYLIHSETKLKQGGQEIDVVMDFSNYKELPEGIVMPMTMSSQEAGNITYKSIEINKPIDENIFKP